MTKQDFYHLSHAYRQHWTQLKDAVLPLMKSPIISFSAVVDTSVHHIDCPKADQFYKMYCNVNHGPGEELKLLKAIRDNVNCWIELLEKEKDT